MEQVLQEYTVRDVYIRHAVDPSPADSAFSMHIHSRCEIFCFVSGEAEYLVEGSSYPLEPGCLLIMRPAESHRVKILGGKPYERYSVNFPLSAADSIDPQRRLMRPFLERPLGRENFYSPAELNHFPTIDSLKRMCGCSDDYESGLEIPIRLFSLLDALRMAFQAKESGRPPQEDVPGQILAYINQHLFEELSTAALAKRFFMSQSQFNRVVKNAAGVPPWKYITLKRLTAAKVQIRSGVPAATACLSCGFGDYSSFYRAYSKHFGAAPTQNTEGL